MNQVSCLPANKKPKTARGRRTKEKLLEAAESVFGERGFHDAAISAITQRAGVALGTFYVYFESKEEVFRALVAHMGHLTRAWISKKIEQAPDRLAAERQGLEAFIEFSRQHKNLYRIVAEAQFVAEDSFREYYSVFAQAYAENLEHAAQLGEIRKGNFEQWAWALIGMNVFLGMRYAVWGDSRPAAEIAADVGELIERGLSGQPSNCAEKEESC